MRDTRSWVVVLTLLVGCRAEKPEEPVVLPDPATRTYLIRAEHVETIRTWPGIRLGRDVAEVADMAAKEYFRPFSGTRIDRATLEAGKELAAKRALATVEGEVSRDDRLQLEALVDAAIDLALVLEIPEPAGGRD